MSEFNRAIGRRLEHGNCKVRLGWGVLVFCGLQIITEYSVPTAAVSSHQDCVVIIYIEDKSTSCVRRAGYIVSFTPFLLDRAAAAGKDRVHRIGLTPGLSHRLPRIEQYGLKRD